MNPPGVTQRTVVNLPKLIFALVATVCSTFLMAIGAISAEAGVPFLALIAGYILGNGVAYAHHQLVQPIVGRTEYEVARHYQEGAIRREAPGVD